jgi:hypothetical protein
VSRSITRNRATGELLCNGKPTGLVVEKGEKPCFGFSQSWYLLDKDTEIMFAAFSLGQAMRSVQAIVEATSCEVTP